MPLLLGNHQVPVDDTTLVVYRGSRKPIYPERKRDLARRCGISFIKLMFKGNLSSTVGVCGFQHVKLRSQPRKGGGTEPAAQWHINIYTNKPMAEGAMDFVPDEMGTGYAYLPDSPFNRVRLAYAEIPGNALWIIEDEKIRSEIQALANKIKKSIEFITEQQQLKNKQTEIEMKVHQIDAKRGVEHKTRLQIEVQVMEKQLEELELLQKRDMLKKRIIQFQSQHPEIEVREPVKTKNETEELPKKEKIEENIPIQETMPEELSEEETTENYDEMIDQTDLDIIRERAKIDIHHENKELIDSIKQDYNKQTGKNRGWAFSQQYREKIAPKIERRMKELLEKNEHSTTGVTT